MEFDPKTDFITREERYLTVMAGNSNINYPDPITREERFLAAMCDSEQTAPDPITRREQYLSAIIENIGSGGGGQGELIATDEVTVSTTSTTAALAKTITLPDNISVNGNYLYVRVRDKAGVRDGYCYGSDNYGFGSTSSVVRIILKGSSSVIAVAGITGNGVYLNTTTTASNKFKSLDIFMRYNSSYGTIDGTFTVEVFLVPIS